MHVKKDDVVQVIAGDDKGKRGKVLRVLPKEGKVVVEGINRTKKSVKPNKRNPQGGQLSVELPMAASNVLLIDPQDGKPTRIGVRVQPDGSKVRYSKRTGADMGRVAPPKARRAAAAQAKKG